MFMELALKHHPSTHGLFHFLSKDGISYKTDVSFKVKFHAILKDGGTPVCHALT